jgi:hypothetical protein
MLVRHTPIPPNAVENSCKRPGTFRERLGIFDEREAISVVRRGLLHVIDHQDRQRALLHLKFQPELLVDGIKE